MNTQTDQIPTANVCVINIRIIRKIDNYFTGSLSYLLKNKSCTCFKEAHKYDYISVGTNVGLISDVALLTCLQNFNIYCSFRLLLLLSWYCMWKQKTQIICCTLIIQYDFRTFKGGLSLKIFIKITYPVHLYFIASKYLWNKDLVEYYRQLNLIL